MIRYKLTYLPTKEVHVWIDADHADTYAPIQFEGQPFPIELVQEYLFRAFGMDGHILAEVTTPLDLAAAMSSPMLSRFSPELLEGGEILSTTTRKGLP